VLIYGGAGVQALEAKSACSSTFKTGCGSFFKLASSSAAPFGARKQVLPENEIINKRMLYI
jgi:hypothetical protein